VTPMTTVHTRTKRGIGRALELAHRGFQLVAAMPHPPPAPVHAGAVARRARPGDGDGDRPHCPRACPANPVCASPRQGRRSACRDDAATLQPDPAPPPAHASAPPRQPRPMVSMSARCGDRRHRLFWRHPAHEACTMIRRTGPSGGHAHTHHRTCTRAPLPAGRGRVTAMGIGRPALVTGTSRVHVVGAVRIAGWRGSWGETW
jgi:hypothetical protein